MKRFFDSSVLVAVFYADHPQHTPSTKVFLASVRDDFCALRTLGEVYATLTGLPIRPRITAPEGMRVIQQLRERLTLVTLDEQDYVAALEMAYSTSVVGAAAYDALIARCALKAQAEVLLTWNVRDFVRLGAPIAPLVKTPHDL